MPMTALVKRLTDSLEQTKDKAFASVQQTQATLVKGALKLKQSVFYALGSGRWFYDEFQQTLAEGHYREKPLPFWAPLKLTPGNWPETSPVAAGGVVLDTGRTFAKRLLWGGAFALLAFDIVLKAGVALIASGLALYGYEYYRSTCTRKETITEVNFAGQRVEGTRKDLCRLYQAQIRIMNIAGSFKQASMASTGETAAAIIKSVAAERKRIKVLNPGIYGAKNDVYDFSEPQLKLVEDGDDTPVPRPAKAGALQGRSLKDAWDDKAPASDDEIVEKFMALESALPPHILEAVQKRRASEITPASR